MENDEYAILLCGPFDVTDSAGRKWRIDSVSIFNEGYGSIDVYVMLETAGEEVRLHEDSAVIRQILRKLRSLGYDGPDFGPGDEDLQDDTLIVLAAPEEFESFAAAKGWRNLADDYADDVAQDVRLAQEEDAALAVYSALMARLRPV